MSFTAARPPCPYCGTDQRYDEATERGDQRHCRNCGERIVYSMPWNKPEKATWQGDKVAMPRALWFRLCDALRMMPDITADQMELAVKKAERLAGRVEECAKTERKRRKAER